MNKVLDLTNTPLRLDAVAVGYKNHLVAKDISATLKQGSVTALLGPNGSGKSTLIEAIAFGETHREGHVLISGEESRKLKLRERSKMVSIVRSKLNTEPYITVEELVSLGRTPYLNALGSLTAHDSAIIHRSILDCQLKGFEKRKIGTLSDGERQRALIAMSLTQETPLMLMDEPTSHLDIAYRIELFILLKKIARESHRAVLLATHELGMAMQWCDNLWLLDRNSHFIEGIPEELALSRKLDGLFDTGKYSFDPYSGKIDIFQKKMSSIGFKSDGSERALWTERLLQRLGYISVREAPFSIELLPKKWCYKTPTFSHETTSLTELEALLTRKD